MFNEHLPNSYTPSIPSFWNDLNHNLNGNQNLTKLIGSVKYNFLNTWIR